MKIYLQPGSTAELMIVINFFDYAICQSQVSQLSLYESCNNQITDAIDNYALKYTYSLDI